MDETQEKPNFYALYQKVGSIEGRLDTIEGSLNKITENHDVRINCLEKITDQFVGKASIFGAICGLVGAIIVSVVSVFIKK